MAMQMLCAGGIAAMSDAIRTPDEDNPRGYFEFERVKQLKSDTAWLDEAHGKVVKIIHLLLMELPTDREYRVIFMRRNLHEVIRSQAVMLERSGRRGAALAPDRLIAIFEAQLKSVDSWLAERPNFKVLSLEHAQFIANPAGQAHAINAFLGGQLDESAMTTAVDPALHRNRVG